jgi:glycosyltransferase involved in cell wall biosynthesis
MIKGIIWLINPYGNIPGEGWTEYRFSMVARCLANAGFQVRWFVADFEHRSKAWREANEIGFEVQPGYTISIIKSSGYARHISLKRILFERKFANNVLKSSIVNNEIPDLIIFGEPALFVADIYKKIAKKSQCPYIVDILDLWPEIFITIFPKFLIKFEKIILSPLYIVRWWFFNSAIGFTAVAPDYLYVVGSNNEKKLKEIIYIGISNKFEDELCIDKTLLIPQKNSDEIWLVYAGTLGRSYDIESIMKLSILIRDRGVGKVKIMVVGDGEMRIVLEKFILSNLGINLFYLGKLNTGQLKKLYEISDIAISSYSKSSPVSMPLKVYDYFYYGLPIINSLDREVSRLVREREVGIQYQAGNIESMWDAFISLYNNKELRIRIGNNSKKLGKSFTFELQYLKYVNFIKNVHSK